jgi:hypothetical protein
MQLERPGKITILVDRRAVRRWHGRLAQRLARLLPESAVRLRAVEGDAAYPASVELLLALESIVLRRMRPTLCGLMPTDESYCARGDESTAELVIDLSGGKTTPGKGATLLRPLYNGSPDERAAVAALMSGGCPLIALETLPDGAQDGGIVATGLPSLEAADGLTGGLEAVFSRVITLIEQALLSPGRMTERPEDALARPSRAAAAFFVSSMVHTAARQIYHLCCHSPHWRVGWRFIDGPGVLETGSLNGGRWSILPEGEAAFAADPFPVEHGGESYIFFERLDYGTGKGVICAQKIDAAGPAGPPVLALEEPWHLSYPFLFLHEGALYMLPEASASGAVSLYICAKFPDSWRRVGDLLSGIEAADATIFRHAGRFWMTSVVRDGVGGYSDTLAIHHAADLFGPWEEHARRPALVDARLARPAGAVVARDGALWRPTQDCSAGYGRKLALARIDRLDPDTFEQTRVHLLAPGRHWPGDRLHTLNRWGRLECIDGAILTPKNRTLRRMTHHYIDARAIGAA